jgi:hypothetical protein
MNGHDANPKKKPATQRSALEKARLLVESSRLSGEALGAFLRREGVREAELANWRTVIEAELGKRPSKKKQTPEERRIRELEKELNRKDRALAEVTALLALKKRIQEIWGDGDESTPTRSET